MSREFARGLMGFSALAMGGLGMLTHDVSSSIFGLTMAVLTVAMSDN